MGEWEGTKGEVYADADSMIDAACALADGLLQHDPAMAVGDANKTPYQTGFEEGYALEKYRPLSKAKEDEKINAEHKMGHDRGSAKRRASAAKLDSACAMADALVKVDAGPKYKVGQHVFVKYDIEQVGKIEKVINDRWADETQYEIRVHEGDYVNNRSRGAVVTFSESEIF